MLYQIIRIELWVYLFWYAWTMSLKLINFYIVFDDVLSSMWIWIEYWSLKIFLTKNLCKKIIPSNLLWTRSSFFNTYLRYDSVIIKQPSNCSFGKKVRKF